MDEIRAATPVEDADVKTSRPWLRAILSGAVFGGLAAAATNWMAFHSQPIGNRNRVNFGRNWATGLAGVASGAVAMYSTLRTAEEAPAGVDNDGPDPRVAAESIHHASKVTMLSPGQRSL